MPSITKALFVGALALIPILPSAAQAEPRALRQAPQATLPLVLGEQGAKVRSVQRALSNRGYTVYIDGIYGVQTRTAVTHWQGANGLKRTGKVGLATWRSLGLHKKAPVTPSGFPPNSATGPDAARQALIAAGASWDEVEFAVPICMRESHCRLDAHNWNPNTRDDSWGPWQINYYGSLAGRVHTIGPRESNSSSWQSATQNFLKLLRTSGRCHWIPPNYCAG